MAAEEEDAPGEVCGSRGTFGKPFSSLPGEKILSERVSEWFGLCIFVSSYLIFPSPLRGREDEMPQCTDGITEVPRHELTPGKRGSWGPCRALAFMCISDRGFSIRAAYLCLYTQLKTSPLTLHCHPLPFCSALRKVGQLPVNINTPGIRGTMSALHNGGDDYHAHRGDPVVGEKPPEPTFELYAPTHVRKGPGPVLRARTLEYRCPGPLGLELRRRAL